MSGRVCSFTDTRPEIIQVLWAESHGQRSRGILLLFVWSLVHVAVQRYVINGYVFGDVHCARLQSFSNPLKWCPVRAPHPARGGAVMLAALHCRPKGPHNDKKDPLHSGTSPAQTATFANDIVQEVTVTGRRGEYLSLTLYSQAT